MASHNHFALQAIAILRLLTRKVTQAVRLDTASESCALVLGVLLVAAGYTCVSRAETKPIELSPQQLQLDIGLTAEPLWIDLRGPFFDALAVAYSETLRLKFLNWVLYAKDVLHGVISIVPDMGKILYISKVGKNT